MRPVAASIRVNPPVVTQTDPRPTARPRCPGVSRSTVVMTLPETGSMRTTCDSPFGPRIDADPDLRAVARHRAVQRHPQADIVRRGIDPHHRPVFWMSTQTPPGPAVMICGPADPVGPTGIVATTGWSRDRCA